MWYFCVKFNGVLCISRAYFRSEMSLFSYFYDTIVKLLVYGKGSVQHRPFHFPATPIAPQKHSQFNGKQFFSIGNCFYTKRMSVFCSALRKLLRWMRWTSFYSLPCYTISIKLFDVVNFSLKQCGVHILQEIYTQFASIYASHQCVRV